MSRIDRGDIDHAVRIRPRNAVVEKAMNRRLIAKLTLAFCSIAFVLAIGEVGIRLLMPQRMSIWSNTRDGLEIHWPGLKTYLHNHNRILTINSAGMRDREHEIQKPNGVFRILVLGDSFMEALQVDWEDSLPGLLDRDLAADGVEVITAAVSGWSTAKQVTYLERYGLAYEPDLVLLVMTLHNDFIENRNLPFHSIENGLVVANPPEYMSVTQYASLKAKAFMSSHSHLFRLAFLTTQARARKQGSRALEQHVSELFRHQLSPELELARDLTRQLFIRLVRVSRDAGARVAVVLIPLSSQLSDEKFEKFLTKHRLDSNTTDREQPQKWVKEWAAETEVPVVDLLDAFRSWTANHEKWLHVADGHWGKEGHALAAEETLRQLHTEIRRTPDARRQKPPVAQ